MSLFNRKSMIALVAGLCMLSVHAATTKVFLFAGQSNMDGRGDGGQLSEAELQQLAEAGAHIQFAYNHEPVRPLGITDSSDFIRKKFKLEKTFGPELFFGLKMAEKYPEEPMLFIKRSIGGTSLYGCWNPDWTVEKAAKIGEDQKPKLYNDFIAYVQETLKELPADRYEICGMFWVQGEADSNVKKWGPEPADQYGANLKQLIESVRRELEVPNLPFFMYEVGTGNVIQGMKNVSAADPRVFLVQQSWDENSRYFLPRYPPPVGHYNYTGMKRIGLNFFESWNSRTSLPVQ